jgi:hypothetical protein
MRTLFRIILAALVVTTVHVSGYAMETGTMSCKGGIVSIGDTAGEVISKCGQPATTTQREQKRVEKESRSTRGQIITSVTIDDWIFNFGPSQFQYQLILGNGRVARIESLDYGY